MIFICSIEFYSRSITNNIYNFFVTTISMIIISILFHIFIKKTLFDCIKFGKQINRPTIKITLVFVANFSSIKKGDAHYAKHLIKR